MVLIAIQWIPTWQGLDGNFLRPCAFGKVVSALDGLSDNLGFMSCLIFLLFNLAKKNSKYFYLIMQCGETN